MTPERLTVWLGDEPVGDLEREGRRFDLRFRPRHGASRSLTVAAAGAVDPWTPSFTRAWFDGLLPEESRRTAAEAEHDVARGDTFGLLAAIGWECAGAVSVLPPDRTPAGGSYRALDDDAVRERLDALPRSVADDDRDVRLSLGGVQEKLLLARLDDGWLLPLDGATSTHILKPEPAAYRGLAVAEAWSLAVASAVTPTARASLLADDGRRATVVVERYDRVRSEGRVDRIHQEDGCQVLGLPPEQKYPRSVGPRVASLSRIAALLVARADDPIPQLDHLLQQTVVTVALLNADAHAKNLSVLHDGAGTVTLAPLYDVAPTVFFLPTQAQTALSIGGKWRIREIERSHLLGEARAWGMPPARAREVIDGTLHGIEAGLRDADARYPETPPGMRAAVDAQLERLLQSA